MFVSGPVAPKEQNNHIKHHLSYQKNMLEAKEVNPVGLEEEKGRVCVTGGTGFIASWIIKRLLEDGYSVNTTVRSDPEHKKDVSFLTNLPGASRKLQIFNADLSDPESFSLSIEGCVGVFHLATPFDFGENESVEIVSKRCSDGALGILKACLNTKTVKRVIYTSSATAVASNGKDAEVMDESFWSDVEYLKAFKPSRSWPYAISKTLTEKAVLEYGEKHGLEVVSVIPPLVAGPFICPKLHGTVRTALAFALGIKDLFPYILQIPMAHADDVARAHIFLLEHPNPKGRYNCSPCLVTIEKLYELFSAKHPEFKLPTIESLKEIKGPKLPALSSKKLVDVGYEFKYGLEEIIEDALQCCKQKGYL